MRIEAKREQKTIQSISLLTIVINKIINMSGVIKCIEKIGRRIRKKAAKAKCRKNHHIIMLNAI